MPFFSHHILHCSSIHQAATSRQGTSHHRAASTVASSQLGALTTAVVCAGWATHQILSGSGFLVFVIILPPHSTHALSGRAASRRSNCRTALLWGWNPAALAAS